MKKVIPGLLLTVLIALCAKITSSYIQAIGAVSIAIILGILAGNTIKLSDKFNKGIAFSEKNLLTYAIMLMGFKLELGELGEMGTTVFLVVLPTMLVTITSGIIYGKFFGFSKSFSLLMGAGNAVCGSSAIAAVAPATDANEEEIGVSIGIVNLLGTIGIFLMPLLASLIHLSEIQSSYLTGGVLQAIGQVVAAGYSISDKVGDTATLIKMLRVIMIGPIVMLVTLLNKTSSSGDGKGKKKYIPNYIIGFFICSIIASIFPNEQLVLPYLRTLAKLLLMVAMAGVGMKISFKSLINHGPKALLFGVLTTTTQTIFIMILILLFLN